MKKSISKKLLSLFLAVMLLATTIPFAAFNVSAAEPVKASAKYKYVFAYFTATSTDGQKVNLAVSDDGLNYTRMTTFNGNGSTGIMKQAGSLAKRYNSPSARDPFLFDGKDGYYYIIATDADCSISDSPYWDNSRSFVLWRSRDLLNWSEEKLINMESITGETVYRAWAPQVYVLNDAEMEARGDNNHEYPFMVYFAMASSNTTGGRTDMYCSFAKDLYRQETWTKPQLQYRPCDDVQSGAIDGDIVKIGDEYIMYVKDEDIANNSTGTLQTYWVSASTPWGPYENQKFSTDRLVTDFVCEGANSFYIGNDLYMIVDSNASQAASADNMKLLKATDATGKHFTNVTSTTNIPSLTPKHGSILTVPVADSDLAVTENEYEVTGNVVIDNPVVYTHGKYAGLAYHPYSYMMNGAYISNGWFDGEYAAPTYSLRRGAPAIEAVYAEGTNAVIGFETGKLTGYLGDGFNSNTVTFVFKFVNGTYEKHTLAVKTNPVAVHTVSMASTQIVSNGARGYVGFEVLAKGSNNGGGAAVTKGSGQSGATATSMNFQYMYNPTSCPNISDSNYAFQLPSLNTDKNSGYFSGYMWYTRTGSHSEQLRTSSNIADYYLDLSAPESSKGVKYSNGQYSIELIHEFLNWSQGANNNEGRTTKISTGITPNVVTDVSGSSTMAVSSTNPTLPTSITRGNKQLTTITISGTPQVGTTTGKYVLGYFNKDKWNATNGQAEVIIDTNIRLNVSNKGELRNLYNQYRNEYKIAKCYTTDSWNAYVTALRAAENYLGNPESIDTAEMARDLNSLKLAYDALTPVDDITAHQAPVTDDTLITNMSDVYVGLEATCGSTGHKNQTCQLCGKDFEVETIPVQPHTYKYVTDTFDKATFSCEWIDINKCNNSFNNDIDFQVYSALDMVYNTIDHSKYTAAGDEALVAAYEKFVALKDAEFVGETAQIRADITTAIDNAQRDLLNAINTVNADDTVNGFNVTFKVMVDDKETYSTVIPGKYGDIVSLDASAYTNGLTCTTWKVNVDKTDYANGYVKNIANASNTYDVLVQSDTTVIAYASAQDTAAGIPVTINDQYANALYSLVAPADTAVTFESVNKIKIGEMTYEVPNMPFYKITSWQSNNYANGNNGIVATDAATTIGAIAGSKTDGLVITPVYDKPEGLYTITLDGEEIANLEYDKGCTVRISAGATNYGIAIKNADNSYSVVSYSNANGAASYTFYANRPMDFYTVTKVNAGNQTIYAVGDKVLNSTTTDKAEKLMIHNLDNKLPFVYSGAAETETGKFTTFSAFSKNAGNQNDLKIVEAGTLYTKADVDADSFVIGANGVYTAVSKNQVELSNQYSLSLKNSVGKGVKTRAYVKYSYVYGGETIEAIAYGNICTL